MAALVVGTLGCGTSTPGLTEAQLESEGSVQLLTSGSASLDFAAAAEYSAERCGLTMLVAHRDQILFEDYANGHQASDPVHLFSGTKAFWSVGVAAMIEDGLLQSFDQVATEILPEWERSWRHAGKDEITLRDLMTLSSGLNQSLFYLLGLEPRALNTYSYAVNNLRLTSPPGTDFSYGPSNYYVVGAMMQRQLESQGRDPDPLAYLQERIFDPIGLTYSRWQRDRSGNAHIPNGAFLTAREWVKFGQLLLNQGRWNGQTVVDANLMAALTQPSDTNPGHGLFLWLNQPAGFGPDQNPVGPTQGFIYHDGFPDLIGALGAGKSRMYVIPSAELVILRQADAERNTYEDHEFLSLLFGSTPDTLSRPMRFCRSATE
jgi:CubicO group peptidase (beta-lactamase class C family)